MRLEEMRLEYANCNYCGKDETVLLYRVRGGQLSALFNIVKCRTCGLVYTNPRLCREQSHLLYDEQYYEGKGFDPRFKGNTVSELGAKMLLRWLRSEFFGSRTDLRLLDVGGGGGKFALFSQELGLDAMLVETSEAAAQHASRLGVKAHVGEIADDFFPGGNDTYDVITAWEVLEHLYDPITFLRDVYRLLRRGGLFIYTTGNVNEAKFLRGRWGYFRVPEGHLYFFSPITIKLLLKEAGFRNFIDPYRLYHKETLGVRFLARLGVIDMRKDTHPDSPIEKAFYCYAYKWMESVVGRRRLPFAMK